MNTKDTSKAKTEKETKKYSKNYSKNQRKKHNKYLNKQKKKEEEMRKSISDEIDLKEKQNLSVSWITPRTPFNEEVKDNIKEVQSEDEVESNELEEVKRNDETNLLKI